MDGKPDSLFFREKPTLVLLALENMDPAYAALVAKRIDSTFAHTINILSQLEKHGLIKSRPEGRVRYLEFTERGRRVAQKLRELKEILHEQQEQWNKLERISQLVNSTKENGSTLHLGPLRRDLAKLKSSGNDELYYATEEIDSLIQDAIASSKK